MKRTTVLWLLVAAVAAWGAWTLLSSVSDVPAPGAGLAGGRTAPRADRGAVTADKVPVVVSDLAIPSSGEIFLRERSLFDYAQSPEELAAIELQRRRAAEETRRRAAEAAAQAAQRAEEERKRQEERDRLLAAQAAAMVQVPQAPPKPVPPSFPYQYVGTIGPMDDPFAILGAPDRTYRYVRAGEAIDRDFRLEYIAEARLDLSYLDERFQDQFTQVHRKSDATASAR